MPNAALTTAAFDALIAERDALRGELKVVKVERDLLKEKLNAFLRKLFAAKSEARGNGQSDLFNEAEALASAGPMAEEISVESGVEIVGHIYPVGSLVRLSSQRLVVVVEPGKESLLTPIVRIFFSLRSNEPIPMQTIDLAAPSCKDSIAGPEDPIRWNFTNIDDLWMT